MKVNKWMLLAVIAAICFAGNTGYGEEPVPPVTGNTLWHWLGIPQGCNKIKDANLNRSGDRPGRERKPPLKRIADPANLKSENPAIKKAAEIKAAEDLAPQKVKAIKYLATVGCGCHPGVRDALLAALDDCTEEVRYQAAIALCQVAGNPCKNCDKSGCCNAEVMNKLNEVANGQDAQGCFKESSARVRQAAASAMNACRRKNPTTPLQPIPQREDKELPIENVQPETKELPTEPDALKKVPTPAPLPPSGNRNYAPPASQLHVTNYTRETNNTGETSYTSEPGTAVVEDSSPGTAYASPDPNEEGIAQQVAFLGFGDRCRRRAAPCPQWEVCPEQSCPIAQGETVKQGEAPAPPAMAENVPSESDMGDMNLPPSNALASNYGAASGPLSSAPNMIGDFFGGAGVPFLLNNEPVGYAPMPGNGVPRFKMAENTSPLPQDRVYFDFSSYSNVPLNNTRSGVNSYSGGFEKTFFDGIASIELRAPFASTLDDDVYFDGTTTGHTGEFGDLAVAFKTLLLRRDTFLLSGGLAVTAPTARDTQIFMNRQSTNSTFLIENQSVHLMPFVGGMWTPNDRWFGIGYLQVDVDANGNKVSAVNPFVTPTPPQSIGRYSDSTVMYADFGLGYWALRDHDSSRFCTGLAYVVECHMNQSLTGQQVLNSSIYQIGTVANNVSFTDMTVGVHLELFKLSTLTAAYCTSLTPDNDRQFDSQFRLLFNRRF